MLKEPCFVGFMIVFLLFANGFGRQVSAAADDVTDEESVSQIWVTTLHYNWFLNTELPPSQFKYIINGKQEGAGQVIVQKYKDMLHVRFKLKPGNNSIIVEKQGVVILKRGIFSAPSYESESVPEEAKAVYFHAVPNETPCRPCHRLDTKKSDMSPRDVTKQICFPCHSHKFDDLKYPHKPATGQWRCLACHRYKAVETDLSPDQPLKFTVDQENGVAPLCFKCHKKKQQQIKKFTFVHGPIGMGACNACHNPHGSQLKYFLHKDITSLCVECHELQDMLKNPFVHRAIRNKGCIACHDPHGSMHSLQLIAGLNDLCYKCHPQIYKLKNNHPVQGHPVSAPVDPSNKQNKLTCVSCHSPHSSEYPYLLPVDDPMMLCSRCHPTKE